MAAAARRFLMGGEFQPVKQRNGSRGGWRWEKRGGEEERREEEKECRQVE